MKSPFPGFDPYLEVSGMWPDLYAGPLTYIRDAIDDRLPDRYVARIDERFRLMEVSGATGKGAGPMSR